MSTHLFSSLMYVGRSSCKVSQFFSRGMEADRNVKVVEGDVAVLLVGRGQVATLYYPLNACDEVELQ